MVPANFLAWEWETRAMIAYRSGDSESTVRYVMESQKHQPVDFAQPCNFAVLALAKKQLGQLEEARDAFVPATQLAQKLFSVPRNRSNLELLIAQLLLREARSQLKAEVDLTTNPNLFDTAGPEVVPATAKSYETQAAGNRRCSR